MSISRKKANQRITATRLASLLRYLAAPFILIALWSELQPASFPSWVINSSLAVNAALLISSILIKTPGFRQ